MLLKAAKGCEVGVPPTGAPTRPAAGKQGPFCRPWGRCVFLVQHVSGKAAWTGDDRLPVDKKCLQCEMRRRWACLGKVAGVGAQAHRPVLLCK